MKKSLMKFSESGVNERISYEYPFMIGQILGSNSYIQHEKINTRTYKKYKDPNLSIHLVQEIRAHEEPVWAAKFSPCGNYLATGGKDGVLKIWKVTKEQHQGGSEKSQAFN